ncbi:MAG: hypothetical protein GC152_09840 [Alphaproteobacteria bacterium]|nr:hypothetical protein [Alphaproteobacteria bacterium]
MGRPDALLRSLFRIFLRWIAAILAVGAAIAAPALAEGAGELRDVRFGITSATESRIVLDLAGQPDFRISGDNLGSGRIFVDFTNLSSVRPDARRTPARGLLAGATYEPKPDVSRITLALRRPAKIDDVFVIPPSDATPLHRVVIDVSAASKEAFVASLPAFSDMAAAPKPTPPKIATAAPAGLPISESGGTARDTARTGLNAAPSVNPRRGVEGPILAAMSDAEPKAKGPNTKSDMPEAVAKPVVVIDPGHGGSDPGAVGVDGLREKLVTLAAAKALAAHLNATGRYKVVLTREGDERLALEERTPIARRAGADLFISLHADALKDTSVRGASVYTLSDEGTRRSANVAAEEGDLVVFDVDLRETDPEVRDILFDLAHEHTGSRSDQLAEQIVAKLGGVTPLLNNTHRRGDLRVLLAPDVPAVLLELGFLSNAADEANFKSEAWRIRTMKAVADAIDAYFAAAPLERHAAAANSAGP